MALPIANAGPDQQFTFASLPTSAVMAGSGSFFAPATAIVSYLWELVEKPVGSAAALSSTVVQNPTLNTIDTPGTYLLFLRVTDDIAQQSLGGKLVAESSAYVSIRAELTNGLVKPAPGERDHYLQTDAWADRIDTEETALDTHEADTTDPHNTLSVAGTVAVADAPAGAGEVLTSTSAVTAAWAPAGAVADASTGTKGITYLAEAAVAPASPKAVTRDRSKLSALINDSFTALGWEPGEVKVQLAGGNHNQCHKVWYVDEDNYCKTVDLGFLDGGLIAGGGYTVKLIRMTPAQFVSNTLTDVLATMTTGAPVNDNEPISDVANAVGTTINGGNWLGILVTSGSGGAGLNVTVNLEKRW
jgi:hypothetical protein